MKQILWYNKKPYFFYKIYHTKPDPRSIVKNAKGIKVYYERIYNKRTGKTAWAVYLTKRITWY